MSGDTGGSAIQSSRGLGGVDVLYPRGGITPVQEKQMITCLENNIHMFAADGSSDDIDMPIRRLFSDQKLFSQILTAGAVRDEGIVETMQTCWKENQYLLCPPTAGIL
ncbi:unnamed protein product [Coregonus sp. 'balchen']|nr:unnamed protein product [Coregonus sp. 'balchen']